MPSPLFSKLSAAQRASGASILALAGLLALAQPAAAQVSFSGFGTLGYAISDRASAYQRFVDSDGTFRRDSVLGVQADARLGENFSFVAQAKLAPSIRDDSDWDPTLTWAFLAWRPSNELLVRLGRLRVPYYLNSPNLDVGVTYNPTQLPTEVYSISPTNETNGIALSHTWILPAGDLGLEAYWGSAHTHTRFFIRDDLRSLGGPDRGAVFVPLKIDSRGFALTLNQNENVYRIGYHYALASRRDGGRFRTDTPFVSFGSEGFYVPDPGIVPGLVIPSVSEVRFGIFTAGLDIALPGHLRLLGEYARRSNLSGPKGGLDTRGGYLSLQGEAGSWRPYFTASRLISTDTSLNHYLALNGNRVTFSPIPGLSAASINLLQRFAADRTPAYDQSTFALGTAYLLSPTQKLKAEWAVTRVGETSHFVDAPAGGDVRHQNIHVFSFSYNFTF